MRTFLKKKLGPKDKGFTLIELLVVIIIIGILAAIAIPIFLSQRKKAFEASEKSDARSIATQMETFYTDSQVYPAALALGVTNPTRIYFGTADAAGVDYVVLSPNNSAKVYKSSGTGGFCVEVLSTSTDKIAVYDSGAGGLRPMVASTVVAGGTGRCSSGSSGTYSVSVF